MATAHDPRKELKDLFETYKFPVASFSKISGLEEQLLLDFANNNESSLSIEKEMDLIDLIGLLTIGIPYVDEDDRVRGIIQSLEHEFEIPLETIALFSKIELNDVQSFIVDPPSISIEKRYKLGITVMFMHFIFHKK